MIPIPATHYGAQITFSFEELMIRVFNCVLIGGVNKRLLACFALAFLHTPHRASAQFNDARAYDNTAVGTNQLELSYAHVHANASLDPSLTIADASLNLNQGIIDYTRYFGLFHRLAWVEAGVPLAGLSGSVKGSKVQGSTNGAGDSSSSSPFWRPCAHRQGVRQLQTRYFIGGESDDHRADGLLPVG